MKIGIDLGTRNSLVFIPKKGVVLQEPSVVAVDLDENKILAVGKEANEMIGRTPDTIRVYRPMKDGVIADFRVTQAMIRYFIDKGFGKIPIFQTRTGHQRARGNHVHRDARGHRSGHERRRQGGLSLQGADPCRPLARAFRSTPARAI